MISSRDQRRIILLPGKTQSVSESRLQDISTVIKQVQQSRPMRRHPDRSCTYLVLRSTPDEHSVQLKPDLKFPRGGAEVAAAGWLRRPGRVTWRDAIGRSEVEGGHVWRRGFLSGGAR